jgi:ribosomal protein L37AE/L43A
MQPKPPKPKPCKVCKTPFVKKRPFEVWCSPECGLELVKAKQAKEGKAKAKAERQADKAKRERLKTISQLEEECRKIVQEIARIRDRHDGCISCHVGPNYQGIWHGSHYRAHGACSSLQFHLWNIHKACEQCNYFKGGNKEGYITGLMNKPGYGPDRLEWLDSQPKSQRFTRDYLERFKAVMGKRRNRLKRGMGR